MDKADVVISVVFGAIGAILGAIGFVVNSIIAKCLLWIFAILVIALTIYYISWAIKRNRNKPKDFNDFIMRAMKEAEKDPDFAKRFEAEGKRRDALFLGQQTESPDYGYSVSNPIMTAAVYKSDEYLGRLRTTDGKAVTWTRIGAHCAGNLHGIKDIMVDEYQLFLDGKPFKVIYICPYGRTALTAPKGFNLSEKGK